MIPVLQDLQDELKVLLILHWRYVRSKASAISVKSPSKV
jgi:hypothetical protein